MNTLRFEAGWNGYEEGQIVWKSCCELPKSRR
jgi:hypothetical protein